VHPRCTHTAAEMRLYSYKRDRLSGDVLPVPIDKDNHAIDSLRYACGPMVGHKDPLYIWRRLGPED
jgi:phage terminase large subunit